VTVLVTGASGFLGSHVIRILRVQGTAVRALVRPGRRCPWLEPLGALLALGDLSDEPSLARALDGCEGLVHCAAISGNAASLEQRAVNVDGSARLYAAAQKCGVRRAVHVSSLAAVGASRDGQPVDESSVCNTRHLRLSYVETRIAAEERALAAAHSGLRVVIVNPTLCIGPRLDGRVPPQVARALRGRPRWVPTGGASFAGVEDVAAGAVAGLERGRSCERYILGGHNLTWLEFTSRLARELGVRSPRFVVPGAAGRTLAFGADVLDRLHLWRFAWPAAALRTWGWYGYADSKKAVHELGYRIRPLEEILHGLAAARAAE
jgi:dihydroflavonol-4-reductase